MNWLNRRDKSEEGFNDKELFLLIYASLLLVKQSSRRGFTKDKKFLFANVPNGKISSQHEMQYHRLIISLKVLTINVVQFITFNMNPKLTDVTLSCTVFIIKVNILQGKAILELEETHISTYTDRNLVLK